jgi:hypothetical protein
MVRRTLPGASLTYGFTGWVSKAMALIHAVYMTVGPQLCMLTAFFSLVRSVTTDYGTELSTQLICNVLPAFIVWITGKVSLDSCAHLIDRTARLMPRSLRIGGWSHTFAHVMRAACETFPKWPEWLNSLRSLCRILRNASYRKHLAKMRIDGMNLAKLLKSFSAGFAKWRFETLHDVLKQLAPLRDLCEKHLTRESFDGVQEEDNLQDFLTACKLPDLWRFIVYGLQYLIKPLEKFRRWGMLCICHEHERLSGDFSTRQCIWNSRRLRQVPTKVDEQREKFKQFARNLSLDDVENDSLLHLGLVNATRSSGEDFFHRTKYCRSLPWCFANGDTEEGARDCLAQWRAVSREKHDQLTITTMDDFLEDIETVAAGQVCNQRWADEVLAFNLSALDESPGEGYHRSTHHAKQQAPSGQAAYIKQRTRVSENIRQAKDFMRRYKHEGRQVIRFEWINYRRILATAKLPWRPVRMQQKAFWERVYRMDSLASVDWSPFVSKPGCVTDDSEALVLVKESWVEELVREYCSLVFHPLTYYSFPETREVMDGSGTLVKKTSTRVFQVIRTNKLQSRTHVLPTWRKEKDTAKLSLNVLPLAIWSQEDSGRCHVYADSDPYWCVPLDLCSFTILRTELRRSSNVQASESCGQCQVLSDFVEAQPNLPLCDKNCPTLVVLQALKRMGWKQNPLTPCIHDASMVKLCDTRGGTNRKVYYQCLLDLPRTLALTSVMPSNASQTYYRCLMAGKQVEATQSAAELHAILKDVDADFVAIEDQAEEMLPIEGAVAPIADVAHGGDGMIVGSSAVVPVVLITKPKSKAQKQESLLALPAVVALVPVEPVAALGDGVVGPPGTSSSSSSGLLGVAAPLPLPAAAESSGGGVDGMVVPPALPMLVVAAKGKKQRDWHPCISGFGRIFMDAYRPDHGHAYDNWIIQFQWNGKDWEKKRVSNAVSTNTHGLVEVPAYLHCFRDLLMNGTITTYRCKIGSDYIDNFVNMHRPELEALVAHFA